MSRLSHGQSTENMMDLPNKVFGSMDKSVYATSYADVLYSKYDAQS